jgi:hypothetical protein
MHCLACNELTIFTLHLVWCKTDSNLLPISIDNTQSNANVGVMYVSREVIVVPLQDADVKEITWRMDVMIKLMAALFAREFSNIDAIVKLEKMQLSREQIANALGITKENVAQQLYTASKKVEKKAKKSEGQAVAAEPPAESSPTAAEEA